MLNLTVPAEVRVLHRLLRHPRLLYVHFAPPCGTCSRAREVPLQGRRGPRPVRSELYPLGLPDLAVDQPAEVPRVLAANLLYQVVVEAVQILNQNGTAWSIENPRNSLLWHIPGFLDLATDINT